MGKIKYNETQIEKWGTQAVEASISETTTLRSLINSDDKIPLWDGEVFIYNSSVWSNENLIGKVSVQIKGKLYSSPEALKDEITHSIEINDLLKYMTERGVVFFVVLINENNIRDKTIYFETLSPQRIRWYLNGKEHQKYLTIKLKKFPEENHIKQGIFHNFYLVSLHGDNSPINIEMLKDRKDIESFSLTAVSYDPNNKGSDPIDFLLSSEAHWTVKFTGIPTAVPVEIPEGMQLSIITNKGQPFLVKGEKYENYLSMERSKDHIIFKFGESTKFIYNKANERNKVTYTSLNSLKHRIKDLNFFINLLETGQIQNEKGDIVKRGPFISENELDISALKRELETYKQIDEFWKSIGVYDEFIIGEIDSNSSIKELEIFANCMNGKHKVINALDTNEPVTLVKKTISNFTLLLFYVLEDKDKKHFNIYNFSDYERMFMYIIDGQEHEASRYSALKPIDYVEASNIDFSDILKTYKKINITDNNVYTYINQDLLNILLAYDMHENKPHKILQAAQEIAKWLLDKSDDDFPNEIKVINYFQALKRERTLSEKENIILYDIEQNSEELLYKLGANILLDNLKGAQIQFDKLSKEDKEKFKTYPIYNLWNPKSIRDN